MKVEFPCGMIHLYQKNNPKKGKDKENEKILIVVDMQNDFIDGSLGTPEAEAIVDNVVAKINTYTKDCVYATRDTHQDNYLQTQEGENLPIVHCIEGTYGWQLNKRYRRLWAVPL